MDARIKPDVEECVSGLEHRGNESTARKYVVHNEAKEPLPWDGEISYL
jgi:hypothetical protein